MYDAGSKGGQGVSVWCSAGRREKERRAATSVRKVDGASDEELG